VRVLAPTINHAMQLYKTGKTGHSWCKTQDSSFKAARCSELFIRCGLWTGCTFVPSAVGSLDQRVNASGLDRALRRYSGASLAGVGVWGHGSIAVRCRVEGQSCTPGHHF
jgi:hypothetical protein